MENKLTLSILPEKLGICHLAANSPIPSWAAEASFSSITKTSGELSIICSQEKIPAGILFEKDWRAFKLEGNVELSSIGVISALAGPLARAKISIFNISTYETNYVLVEDKNLKKAKAVLSKFCKIK